MKKHSMITIAIVLGFASCTTTGQLQSSRIYEQDKLNSIDTWYIELEGSEPQNKPNVDIKITGLLADVKNRIVSDLFFEFKNLGLNMSKEKNEADGVIKLLPRFDNDLWVIDMVFIVSTPEGEDVSRAVIKGPYRAWNINAAEEYSRLFVSVLPGNQSTTSN
jgi:hypothetical protein